MVLDISKLRCGMETILPAIKQTGLFDLCCALSLSSIHHLQMVVCNSCIWLEHWRAQTRLSKGSRFSSGLRWKEFYSSTSARASRLADETWKVEMRSLVFNFPCKVFFKRINRWISRLCPVSTNSSGVAFGEGTTNNSCPACWVISRLQADRTVPDFAWN